MASGRAGRRARRHGLGRSAAYGQALGRLWSGDRRPALGSYGVAIDARRRRWMRSGPTLGRLWIGDRRPARGVGCAQDRRSAAYGQALDARQQSRASRFTPHASCRSTLMVSLSNHVGGHAPSRAQDHASRQPPSCLTPRAARRSHQADRLTPHASRRSPHAGGHAAFAGGPLTPRASGRSPHASGRSRPGVRSSAAWRTTPWRAALSGLARDARQPGAQSSLAWRSTAVLAGMATTRFRELQPCLKADRQWSHASRRSPRASSRLPAATRLAPAASDHTPAASRRLPYASRRSPQATRLSPHAGRRSVRGGGCPASARLKPVRSPDRRPVTSVRSIRPRPRVKPAIGFRSIRPR
jgi:hypothetical protein